MEQLQRIAGLITSGCGVLFFGTLALLLIALAAVVVWSMLT